MDSKLDRNITKAINKKLQEKISDRVASEVLDSEEIVNLMERAITEYKSHFIKITKERYGK